MPSIFLTIQPEDRIVSPPSAAIVASCNSMFNRVFNTGLQAFLDTATGGTTNLAESAIGGSNTQYRFQNLATEGDELDPVGNIGDYDCLFLSGTDHVSLNAGEQNFTKQWVHLAWEQGRGGLGAETFLQCSWVATGTTAGTTGDLEDDLILKIASYEAIQDELIGECPEGQKMPRIVPIAQVLLEIYRDQVAVTGPTATPFDDLFITGDVTADVHLSDIGERLNLVLSAACMFGTDPTDCPDQLGTRVAPTTAVRDYHAAVIKAVLSNDPDNRYGVDTSGWA
jgi:hypothetical protein